MARAGAWLKYGSLGCLGAGVLALAAVLVVSAAAFLLARPAQVEDRVLTPEIPAVAAGGAARGGSVLLEIGEAELHVEPVEPGEPLRVEARYDVNAFDLAGELDAPADESAPWTYRVTFARNSGAGPLAGLVSLARRSPARVRVFLPGDAPLDLALQMEQGRAVVRLGGLWLTAADVYLHSGALDLSVDEPLPEPMESLSVYSDGGGALLNGLGNASPRRLDVSYRMGHIDMDLGGRWLADAEIDISGEMGGGVVHLPSGVNMQGLDLGEIKVPEASGPEPPTLVFSVYTSMGWLELSDIRLRGAVPGMELTVPPSTPEHTFDGG